jgi:hypothetical protein
MQNHTVYACIVHWADQGEGIVCLLDICYELLVLFSVMPCVESMPSRVLLLGVPGQHQFVLGDQ